MMKPSTFFFLTGRGVRNMGKHWAMTIACVASLSVCMALNIFASLLELNVDSMVSYLGTQNEMVVYLEPEADGELMQKVGDEIAVLPGITHMQFMSKQDVLDQYRTYMEDYAILLDEFENDNPFKANYRVSIGDLSQMEQISARIQRIQGVHSVAAPLEMTNVFIQTQKAVNLVGRVIVIVLMVVSVITVGSTIRLSVSARSREIEIMKYIGATDFFVRSPFVIEGILIGLIGSCIPLGVIYLLYMQVMEYVALQFPALSGLMQFLPVSEVYRTLVPVCMGLGAGIGFLGSFATVRKHLRV